MRTLFVFSLLSAISVLSRLLYRFDIAWVGEPLPNPWRKPRLVVFLNHTSLFEVIFFGAVPFSVLWRLAKRGVAPGADKTLKRPIVGRLFRFLLYRMVSISRQRDETWDAFLRLMKFDDAMVLIAAEGRMKRPSGFDLAGQPMTIRGGVADILGALGQGRMVILYSGGLHHIQAPGEGLPRIFRRVRLRMEAFEIDDYLRRLDAAELNPDELRQAVVADLEERKSRHCG